MKSQFVKSKTLGLSLKNVEGESAILTKSSLITAPKSQESLNKKVASIFESIILTLILISSINLVIDKPLNDPYDSFTIFMAYIDNCFTILFTMEALIKIIALGFVVSNQTMEQRKFTAYMRDPWNILDFIVVCASLLDFIVTIQSKLAHQSETLLQHDVHHEEAAEQPSGGVTDSLQALKALRALRAFRPLRMISRNKGMKLIVNALISSLPSMTNVTIVCLFLMLIFAILGVNFYKGKFQSCSITDDEDIKNYEDCMAKGGTWENKDENFDNVFEGIRILLELMTTEGWLDVMHDASDGVSPTEQPRQDEHWIISVIFFVIFMIIGSQFILNLFVGVIMDNFNKIKEKEEMGGMFVTDDQKKWLDAQRLGLSKALVKKVEKPNGWRIRFFDLCTNDLFENFIMTFIGLNTLSMAVKFDGMPDKMV